MHACSTAEEVLILYIYIYIGATHILEVWADWGTFGRNIFRTLKFEAWEMYSSSIRPCLELCLQYENEHLCQNTAVLGGTGVCENKACQSISGCQKGRGFVLTNPKSAQPRVVSTRLKLTNRLS